MNELVNCPYCSNPVSGEPVKLWDGRSYCRKCIDEVSPQLYEFATSGSRLEETVGRQDVSAFRYVFYMGKWYLALVSVAFGLPFGLLVLAGKGDIWALIFVLAFFGGGGMVLLILKSAIFIVALRSRLPRTTYVEDGEFRVVTPKEKACVQLTECNWYAGSTSADELCMFSGLRRGVVIQTPETQIACGHSIEQLKYWRAFLTLARIPQNPPFGCLRTIAIAGAGMVVGLVSGIGAGYVVSILTNNELWTPMLGFMGLMEGPVVAMMYASAAFVAARGARKELNPLLLGPPFFSIGFVFGLAVSWSGAVVCGVLNAVLGVFVGLLFRTRIRAAKMEREFRQ